MLPETGTDDGRAGHGDDIATRTSLRSASLLIAIGLLLFVAISRLFYKQLHLSRAFEFDRLALIAMAMLAIAIALAADRLRPRAILTAISGVASVSVALISCMLMAVDVAARVKGVAIRTVFQEHHAQIYDPDARYGYVLRPGASDRERTPDYDVRYTVDAVGRRVTPSPTSPRATILMAGDSFTFGTGVEDRETYPHILGAEHWPDVKVINAGVGGWGITQGYLTVVDAISSRTPPDVIVFGMIPDDQFRSFLRTPIALGVTKRLEFVDGRFEMRDVRGQGGEVTITPALVERELEMNRTLLVNMAAACSRQRIPFAIVLMQDAGSYPPDLIHRLGAAGVAIVDLTRLTYERFVHDYHPNPADHRRIAQAIAASAITAMIPNHRQAGHD